MTASGWLLVSVDGAIIRFVAPVMQHDDRAGVGRDAGFGLNAQGHRVVTAIPILALSRDLDQ